MTLPTPSAAVGNVTDDDDDSNNAHDLDVSSIHAAVEGEANDSLCKVLAIFEAAKREGRIVHVSAPMVRYSKLPFRLLARSYNTDITYTPMMLAHEFTRSSIARDADFTTSPLERAPTPNPKEGAQPHQHALIAQFAASDPTDFARAASLISPWVDGIDLNCGCPQSWALKEGIGCSLMSDPDLVSHMLLAARTRLPQNKSLSVKIRIHKNLDETVRWLTQVQDSAGHALTYITIHARTRTQRSSTPPNYAAIHYLRQHIRVPVIANGDAYSLSDVARIAESTGAEGVMAARGILENPALFAGFAATPVKCVWRFVGLAVKFPIPFALVLHHFCEMTGRMEMGGKVVLMGKKERRELMECRNMIDLVDWVEARWGLERETPLGVGRGMGADKTKATVVSCRWRSEP